MAQEGGTDGGRKSGSVRRKKAIRRRRRREQPQEAEKEEDNIGGGGAGVVDGWMDVWLRECDSQVFFFQQASSRRAGRPSISFLAQESSLKHGKLDWLGGGPMEKVNSTHAKRAYQRETTRLPNLPGHSTPREDFSPGGDRC